MRPDVSILIPVYREETEIGHCMRRLRSLVDIDRAEIIVCDGHRGTTLSHIPTESLAVRTIVAPCGRGKQIRAGCELARAKRIMVLHVDTRLAQQALPAAIRALERVPAGAFDLEIPSVNPLVRAIGIAGRFRSRLTRIPYGDQAFFFRTSVLDSIGGFPNIPIMEDVAFMDELRRRRMRIEILPLHVRTSDRRWIEEGPVYTTLRNWFILISYRLGVSPQRIRRFYRHSSSFRRWEPHGPGPAWKS